MAFTKGEGGRPKGSPNTTTSAIREAYESILSNNQDRISNALEALYTRQPAKFLDVMIKLSEFIIPKMRSVEGTIDAGEGIISKIIVEVKKNNESGSNNPSK